MPEQLVTEPTERYYYADGAKIPLAPSRHFVAVKADPQQAGRVAGALASIAGPSQIVDLPEYHLKLVKIGFADAATRTGVAARDVEEVRSLVSRQPDVELGPPVFEVAGPSGAGAEEQALVDVGELIVKFKPGTSEESRRRLLQQQGLELRRADYPEPGVYLLKTKQEGDSIDLANRLHEHDLVEFAHPNFVVLTPRLDVPVESTGTSAAEPAGAAPLGQPYGELDAATLLGIPVPAPAAERMEPAAPPTDPSFPSQWGLAKIRAPQAFDISMGSPTITIGIIDEGNDLTHEDLSYKTPGYDAYDGDDNPTPQPQDAHGTACAGIAAAKANNGRGGSGVAPNCKILPVRIARGVGGGFWDTTSAKVADGIRKAVDRGADVLSNSYGVPPATVVTSAFQHAQTHGRGGKGCPTAAASGNRDARGVLYPARLSPSIPGFLCVGASNEWDQRKSQTSLDGENWWGSSYGPEVDVVAPGVHIFTTDIMGAAGYGGGNYVPNFNGTSSATPHVAGLMALILSVDPDLRSWEVEEIIKLTAEDLGPTGRDEEFGFGRINCRRALEAASRLWYQISIGVEFLGAGRECYMRANVRMYNPGINTVRLDGLTFASFNPTWTTEIDRFEFAPNPGSVLAPRTNQDVRLNRILLRANGNHTSWSYRWSLSWRYTFWRPSAPGLPLGAQVPLNDAEGRTVAPEAVRGSRTGGTPTQAEAPTTARVLMTESLPPGGDLISVDRQTKAVTIVVR